MKHFIDESKDLESKLEKFKEFQYRLNSMLKSLHKYESSQNYINDFDFFINVDIFGRQSPSKIYNLNWKMMDEKSKQLQQEF